MTKLEKFFSKLKNEELIESYNILLMTLKEKEIIRTNNLVGDLGEFIAINFYNKKHNLPNLKLASPNKKAYDAYQKSNSKIRYTIKSTSTKMTGVFWGLEPKGSKIKDKRKFNFVIVVKFGRNYVLENIYEITWENFLLLKSWHSTTKAWKININKTFLKKATSHPICKN